MKKICLVCDKEFIAKHANSKYCLDCQKYMKSFNREMYIETKKLRHKLRQLLTENYEEGINVIKDMYAFEGLKFTSFVTKDIININYVINQLV